MNLLKFIEYEIRKVKDYYVIQCEQIDQASAWGDTSEDAKEALNFVLNALYENYVLEGDKFLSEDAIKLKEKLLRIFKDAKEN